MSKNQSSQSSGLMKLAVAGSAVLAVAAGGLFYYATITKKSAGDEKLIPIEVGAKACDQMNLTLPSGFDSFEIHNRSDRPVEWEILDGVMVVEERENIIPGMKSILRAQLFPGEYEITCGLLSNPRGKLTVTPSEHSEASAAAKPDTRAFIGMLSEYKVFLAMQSNVMLKGAETLQAAIEAGDLEAARAAYLQARAPYKRI
jgi:iron uptake system component EfeO